MKVQTLTDLYVALLRDMHSAETQLTKALPKMAKGASSPRLQKALKDHLAVTEKQLQKVDSLLGKLDKTPGRKKCAAMEGLIEEGKEILAECEDEQVCDCGIIAASQKIEHYEIASYATLRALAETLGRTGDARVLDQICDEEKSADQALTTLAMEVINAEAAQTEPV